MLVLIRGAGDLASGIALRLHHAHLSVVMTDLPQPTAIRRTVCFSQAIVYGSMTVEDVTARFCAAPENAAAILAAGEIPVLADPDAKCHGPAPGYRRRRHSGQKESRHAHHGRALRHRRRARLHGR